jgi:hypothetical protein
MDPGQPLEAESQTTPWRDVARDIREEYHRLQSPPPQSLSSTPAVDPNLTNNNNPPQKLQQWPPEKT